ncbi:TPA: hypothetical protein ACGF6K_003167, partial [Staphylococcus aureus]
CIDVHIILILQQNHINTPSYKIYLSSFLNLKYPYLQFLDTEVYIKINLWLLKRKQQGQT